MSASQHLSQRWHGRHLPPIGLVIIVAAGALVLFGHLGQPPRLAATVAAASGPLQNATPSPTAIPEAPAELPGLIAYTRRADTDYVWEIFQSRADGSDDYPITHHELAGKGADAPRWSPDGQWTVYATTDKSGQTVTLWRMGHAGGTPAPLEGKPVKHTSRGAYVCISTDFSVFPPRARLRGPRKPVPLESKCQ